MDLALGKGLRGLPGPILLTGHTGFKGAWLTFLLEQLQVPVVGLSLKPETNSLFDRTKRTGAIPEIFADICNFKAVEKFFEEVKPSAVIHMAAQPLVLESYKYPRLTFETNVMGTVNVLSAAFSSNSVKVVGVITTDKVYRNDNSGRPFIESDPLAGKDPYSASKVGTEAVVAAWQQISKVTGGPKVIALRAGNVIGGGDWAQDRLLPDLIRGFDSRQKIILRNPESTRPWQHVLDPLLGYILALEYSLSGGEEYAFNFGPSNESLTVQEVVNIAINSWPNPVEVLFSSEMTEASREATALRLDPGLASRVLGWSMKWSQSEAVSSTINWWDSVLNKGIDPRQVCMAEIEKIL